VLLSGVGAKRTLVACAGEAAVLEHEDEGTTCRMGTEGAVTGLINSTARPGGYGHGLGQCGWPVKGTCKKGPQGLCPLGAGTLDACTK